jgi:hypothetical protein
VLGTERTADAGQGDVETFALEASAGCSIAQTLQRGIDSGFDLRL